MINDVLHLVLRANLAGSIAIAAVALLRRPVRGVFGASAAYGLWAIPLVAAVASLAPGPDGGIVAPIVRATLAGLPSTGVLAGASAWSAPLGIGWAFGALVCVVVLATQQLRFALALRGAVRSSMEGKSVVRACDSDIGPAVALGAIVLPSDFETRFTPAEQAAILAHEAQHLARGDVAANAVVAIVQCLCWFNPLVHLAAHWIHIDQELACDADVIAGRPALRRPYAEALLKTPVLARVPPAGCAWRSRGFRALRDRIRLLKQAPPSRPRRAAGALLLAALALGGGCVAWASQAGQGRIVANPDWVSLPNGYDFSRLYPKKAADRGIEGRAVMRCRVETSGALADCRIARETPPGLGFGQAVLRMAPQFRMKPMSVDGRPVAGGLVMIPVKFALGDKHGRRR